MPDGNLYLVNHTYQNELALEAKKKTKTSEGCNFEENKNVQN